VCLDGEEGEVEDRNFPKRVALYGIAHTSIALTIRLLENFMSSNTFVFSNSPDKSAAYTERFIRTSCANLPKADRAGKKVYDFMDSKGFNLRHGANEAITYYAEKYEKTFNELFASVFLADPQLVEWAQHVKSPERTAWYYVGVSFDWDEDRSAYMLPSQADALAYVFDQFPSCFVGAQWTAKTGEHGELQLWADGRCMCVVGLVEESATLSCQVDIDRAFHAIKGLRYGSDESDFKWARRIAGLKNVDFFTGDDNAPSHHGKRLAFGSSAAVREVKDVLECIYGQKVKLNIAGEVFARLLGFESWQQLRGLEKKSLDYPYDPFLVTVISFDEWPEYQESVEVAFSLQEALAFAGEVVDDRYFDCAIDASEELLSLVFTSNEGVSVFPDIVRIVGRVKRVPENSISMKLARSFFSAEEADRNRVLSKIMGELEKLYPVSEIDMTDPRFDFPIEIDDTGVTRLH
jgi:hypothetical protein